MKVNEKYVHKTARCILQRYISLEAYDWGGIGNENLKNKINKKEGGKQSGSDMVLIGNVDGKLLNVMAFIYSLTLSPNEYSIHGHGVRS